MRKPVKTHTFRGKRYNIKHKRVVDPNDKRTAGLCNPPFKKGKSLTFCKDAVGLEQLRIYIHEAGHACLWDLDEFAVDEMSEDIAKFLWRLGYRKVKDVKEEDRS